MHRTYDTHFPARTAKALAACPATLAEVAEELGYRWDDVTLRAHGRTVTAYVHGIPAARVGRYRFGGALTLPL